jgi:hypothetical protein
VFSEKSFQPEAFPVTETRAKNKIHPAGLDKLSNSTPQIKRNSYTTHYLTKENLKLQDYLDF